MFSRRALLQGGAVALFGAGAGVWPSTGFALPDPELAGYIPLKGGRVWYRVNGADHLKNGKAPLLVLHGGPGGNHRKLLGLTALADERAVIFYDQLDSGHSDRPGDTENWTTQRFVSEIDAVRRALDLDRVVLLGHSMGGGWAAAYGIGRPRGLEALVLSSPLISTPRWIADNTDYRKQLPADVQAVLDENERDGTIDSEAYKQATQIFYDKHLCMAPCPVGDLGNDAPAFNQTLYRYMWGPTEFTATGTLVDFDLSKDLPNINAPTLFMCGEFDEATPAACRDFSALVPNARFELIEGAAHAGLLQQPEDYLGTLRGFLKSVGV